MLGIGKDIPAASYAAASVVAAAIGSYSTAQVSFELSMQHMGGRIAVAFLHRDCLKRGARACELSVGGDSVFSRRLEFIEIFLERQQGASVAADPGTGGLPRCKSGCGYSRL